MLVASCPACGAHTPVSVAAPNAMRCPYCRYQGPTPPGVAADLVRAAAVLQGLAVKQRQLSSAQWRALNKSGCASTLYLAFCVVLGAPFALWATAAIATSDPTGSGLLFAAGMGVLPILLLGLAAWLGLRAIRRSKLRLEQACSAEAPAAPGEPARCHVCGAELRDTRSVVARCGFCRADNVLSPSAVERRRARQELMLGDYQRAIAVRSNAVGSTSVRAGLAVFGGALLAPLAALFATLVMYVGLSFCKMPAEPSARYVVVAHAGRRCLARLSRDRAGHSVSDFGQQTPKGFSQVALADPARALRPSDLIGKTVIDPHNRPARVLRVYRTAVDKRCMLDTDEVDDLLVLGTCLEPSPSAVRPEPKNK